MLLAGNNVTSSLSKYTLLSLNFFFNSDKKLLHVFMWNHTAKGKGTQQFMSRSIGLTLFMHLSFHSELLILVLMVLSNCYKHQPNNMQVIKMVLSSCYEQQTSKIQNMKKEKQKLMAY